MHWKKKIQKKKKKTESIQTLKSEPETKANKNQTK